MTYQTVCANGINFAFLEAGKGPTVLLLHGFPDIAETWDYQIPELVQAGFRVVAPYLRGYPPTEIPQAGYYDRATLVLDIKELILAVGNGEPVFLVGQDWGAAIAYGVIAAFPELIRRAVVMAIPHPAMILQSLANPEQVHRAFHWWFFQLPDLPEKSVAANNFAFIDYLWKYWSPGHDDADHIRQIKTMLSVPGVISSTIGYYRAMLNPVNQDPALAEIRKALENPIQVPTLAICGSKDIRGEVLEAQSVFFKGEYQSAIIPDCGHFLHREQPAQVTRLILNWISQT
ncbi:MAG: alpha/beta hydrolase [Acidobacteria bacterium]|nr:alpha/beta hydrolase [Acidobacteriota bacterium]